MNTANTLITDCPNTVNNIESLIYRNVHYGAYLYKSIVIDIIILIVTLLLRTP